MSGYYEKVIRDTRKAARRIAKETGKPASERLAKNPAAKMRSEGFPYATWTCANGTWHYRLHKSYQWDNGKPYARWMVAAKSPYTFGEWELGDTYVEEALTYLDKGSVTCDTDIWTGPGHFLAWAKGGR